MHKATRKSNKDPFKNPVGPPKKPLSEIKHTRSIRVTYPDFDALIKRYGTLQMAIDAMIEEDNAYWNKESS